MADAREVGAAELPEGAPTRSPVFALEPRHRRDHIDDAAQGVAPVERRGGSADDLDALDVVGVDQREVLIRRRAEDRVVQAHAVDERQQRAADQSSHDRDAVCRRRLLDEDAGLTTEEVSEDASLSFSPDRLGSSSSWVRGRQVLSSETMSKVRVPDRCCSLPQGSRQKERGSTDRRVTHRDAMLS